MDSIELKSGIRRAQVGDELIFESRAQQRPLPEFAVSREAAGLEFPAATQGCEKPKGSMLGPVVSMSAQYAIRSQLASAALASELRSVVASEATRMVEMSLQPMESAIARSLGRRRLVLQLVASFGLIALILSAVGICGVLAYSVALRKRKTGIRMALGSTRGKAAALVISQAAVMAAMGLLLGLGSALMAGRAVRSFLFGVATFDPISTVAAALALAVVFAVASSVPAMRAAKVDPAETLRAE